MKRTIVLLSALAFTVLAANAEGMVYDPSVFKSEPYIAADKTSKTSAVFSKEASKTNKDIEAKTQEASNYAQNSLSGQADNFNKALFELDSAQVNMRNKLLEYQSKYQEIDTQYKLLKEQRKVLSSQIREVNRRVKAVEKSKNQIRKTMT